MALEFCDKCKSMHYRTDACRTPKLANSSTVEQPPVKRQVVGSNPASSAKSTAARKDVRTAGEGALSQSATDRDNAPGKGNQAPSVDTLAKAEAAAAHLAPKHKGGRPKLHADRKVYKAEKERQRRARLKAEGK